MKKRFFSGNSFAWIMSFLGFSSLASCEAFTNRQACEYGVPTVEYRAKGTVTGADGNPVGGIRIVISEPDHRGENYQGMDTIYTDSQGKFITNKMQTTGFEPEDVDDIKLTFSDVDGSANGEYKEKEILLGDCNKDKVEDGSGSWYKAYVEVSADVTLEKK